VIPRTLIAFALAVALLVGVALRYRGRRSPPLRLILLAICCFVIVSAAHVFEAFGFFAAAGWGQPRSLGHYIDLAAALLGLVLLGAAVLFRLVRRARP